MKYNFNCYVISENLWKAPEVLRGEFLCKNTKEADVYAFGIILHEIIGRSGPFSTSADTEYQIEVQSM